jgi:hypothetical protein
MKAGIDPWNVDGQFDEDAAHAWPDDDANEKGER